jgi:putative glutamine amidotransferase
MSEPFIGVTCDVRVPRGRPEAYELLLDHRYAEALKRAGGYPVLLPVARKPEIIRSYLDKVDGIIIVGGDDVNPRLYGEKPKTKAPVVFQPRLEFERRLYHNARRIGLPIMGICYGMQLINVLEGGALFQDIRRDAGSKRNHRNRRQPLNRIRIVNRSRLARILRRESLAVHCEHHQAVSRVAPGFQPAAFASDGIIEAIECEDDAVFAVQWHPERMLRSESTHRLFAAFVAAARARRGRSGKV